MLATVRNMAAHPDVPGKLAYSPTTGEEASADAGDYWWMSDPDEPLRDEDDEPMILVRRVSYFEEL